MRIALGAQTGDIRRLIVGGGVALAAGGIALGLGGAYALARFAGNLLYDVQPGDPATYVAIALAIVAIAALASWIPARRAQRVDPVGVLRNN